MHTTAMAASSKVSLKLLIDKAGNRVLFAEAGKEFVDFLFNLMSMPVGTVTRLLTENTSMSMVGSLGNLYDSIETLSGTYLQTKKTRESLLKPKMPSSALNVPILLPNYCRNNASSSTIVAEKKLYQCPGDGNYSSWCNTNASDDSCAVCPNCNQQMSQEMNYIVPPPSDQPAAAPPSSGGGGGGFVKGVVTYMVTDNLVVTPMSSISSITLFNRFGVTGIDKLEERVVEIGRDEVLKLLKESFQSKAVLTNAFLKK